MSDPYQGVSNNANEPGITGENTAGQNSVGVRGVVQEAGWGVLGESNTGTGVVGLSQTSFAIFAKSDKGAGILAQSNTADGVFGRSQTARGVIGISDSQTGVEGHSTSGAGVFGGSDTGEGVHGAGHSRDHGAVVGINDGGGIGVWGEGVADAHGVQGAGIFGRGIPAGFFDGDVIVQGTLEVAQGFKIRGFSLGPEQIQALNTLQQQVSSLQQQMTTLQQLVTNLQGQLASLQSKEAADVQGIANSLVTLAARVSNLGG